MNTPVIPERLRDYLYPIVSAAAILLGAYGVIEDNMIPLWIALGASILGNVTSSAYRPSRTLGTRDGSNLG